MLNCHGGDVLPPCGRGVPDGYVSTRVRDDDGWHMGTENRGSESMGGGWLVMCRISLFFFLFIFLSVLEDGELGEWLGWRMRLGDVGS